MKSTVERVKRLVTMMAKPRTYGEDTWVNEITEDDIVAVAVNFFAKQMLEDPKGHIANIDEAYNQAIWEEAKAMGQV